MIIIAAGVLETERLLFYFPSILLATKNDSEYLIMKQANGWARDVENLQSVRSWARWRRCVVEQALLEWYNNWQISLCK